MAQLVEMINKRRQNESLSYEDYAHRMGLKSSVLYKYIKERGNRDMSIKNFRAMIRFYYGSGDKEMVNALVQYATGLDVGVTPLV